MGGQELASETVESMPEGLLNWGQIEAIAVRAGLDARVVQGVQGALSITDAVEIHIAWSKTAEAGFNARHVKQQQSPQGPPL